MRALAAPVRPPRLAAVQPMTQPPSSTMQKPRTYGTVGAQDGQWLSHYNDWQAWARRYARQIGAASFNATVIADLCSRCVLRVEERVVGSQGEIEWVPTANKDLVGIPEEYRNHLQTPDELIRHHAWHYQVAGEMVQTQLDGDSGAGTIEYGIHSFQAVRWNKPTDGLSTVMTLPDGKVEANSAFVVPTEQVVRFWIMDHEWSTFAWSPMASAIDDLHRWRSLSRYAWRTADSAIAMSGMIWMPGEAFVVPPPEVEDEEVAESDTSAAASPLELAYYEAARMRYSEDDDISAIAPWLIHYDKDLGKPEPIDIGKGLDESGIAHRAEALEDFARATNLPVTTVMGGGVGGANHWSEWLATDKVFASAVAPTEDRITHTDLTQTLLWPRLIVSGIVESPADLANYRLGYDPAPVIVKPDKSAIALEALKIGAISYPAARDAMGFDEDDAPTRQDIALLIEVTRTRLTETGQPTVTTQPAGPATVVQQPPPGAGNTTPPPPPESNGATPAQAAVGRRPFAGPRTGNPLLDKLSQLRSSLGTRLLAAAQNAYAQAVETGGKRVKGRARSRMSQSGKARIDTAVDNEEPLRPLLASVGISELELVRGSFDTFAAQARAEIESYQDKARAAIERAGLDAAHYMGQDRDAAKAVEYLVLGLNAMVRRRLLSGHEAVVAASRIPLTIPRARPMPEGGFDLPGLPNPEDLAGAAARLVRNALAVADHRATFATPPTPDEVPKVVTLNVATVEEGLAAELLVEPQWTWVHGFYGEPQSAFDPHLALGDLEFTTTDREGDPGLTNDMSWPDGDFFQPGDHDGCTCEWVPAEGSAPEGGGPLPGSEALSQAIAEVGA